MSGHPTGPDLARIEALLRGKPPPKQHSPILTGDAFVASYEPPDWLIAGILQRGRLYACTSLTAHGKTAVWLYLACMVQTGRFASTRKVAKGNVLYLAGENPQDLQARMLGMCRQFKIPSLDLPYVLPATFPMTDDAADNLKHNIAALNVPFSLIIGDTAASFFPAIEGNGDSENDNVLAGHYARTLRSLTACSGNPAVVVLSHPVKNATKDNLLPRGGGGFLNELDGNFTLWSPQLGEITTLHWLGKIRGPDFDPVPFRLAQVWTGFHDSDGLPVMTIVASPMDDAEAASEAKQTLANEDAVLRALQDFPDWSFSQIARHVGWLDEDGTPEKYRVQRAIKTLATAKLVEQLRPAAPWTLTNKGKKAINGMENNP